MKLKGWLMVMELGYSTSLTGAGFMLYEFKQVANLKNQGYSDQEIRKKVITENLFEYKKISSLKRGLPYIINRVNALDETLRKLVIDGSIEIQKTINLYAIMKTDRLFFEFMDEVIKEKFQANDFIFERKESNLFFAIKAEQNDAIASWSEATVQRLKQGHRKVLTDIGLLRDLKSGELSRLMIDEELKKHLIQLGDAKYVQAMGE